jgi:uncharacterized membrane protein
LRKLFWIFLAVLLGIGIHIVYVLFVPAVVFDRAVAALSGGQGNNTLVVLPATISANAVPGFAGDGVIALCRLDLSKGKVGLTLKVPGSYWSLAIYSQSGRQVYALNDKQAGADSFEIVIARAKSLVEQVTNVGENDDVNDDIANAAWTVEINEPKGLALLWAPLSDPLQRPAMEAIMKGGRCAAKPAAP